MEENTNMKSTETRYVKGHGLYELLEDGLTAVEARELEKKINKGYYGNFARWHTTRDYGSLYAVWIRFRDDIRNSECRKAFAKLVELNEKEKVKYSFVDTISTVFLFVYYFVFMAPIIILFILLPEKLKNVLEGINKKRK